MTAVRHNHPKRKDLKIEARFLPRSLEDAKRLRKVIRTVIEDGGVAGISPSHAESVADNITGWLVGKIEGVDGLSAASRSRYRKVLAVVEEKFPGDGGNTRPGIAGVLAAFGGVGALAAAPVSPGATAVLMLLGFLADNLRGQDDEEAGEGQEAPQRPHLRLVGAPEAPRPVLRVLDGEAAA